MFTSTIKQEKSMTAVDLAELLKPTQELLKQYFGMKPHQKYEAEQKYNDKEPKICRTSARFRLHE